MEWSFIFWENHTVTYAFVCYAFETSIIAIRTLVGNIVETVLSHTYEAYMYMEIVSEIFMVFMRINLTTIGCISRYTNSLVGIKHSASRADLNVRIEKEHNHVSVINLFHCR